MGRTSVGAAARSLPGRPPGADPSPVSTLTRPLAPAPGPRPPEPPPVAPAPPSSIARASQRFGDAYPPVERQWLLRAVGILYLLAAAIYLPWLVSVLNRELPWLAWPFLAANLVTLACTALSIANQWRREVPEPRPLLGGDLPHVGVIIPCCREPVPMILRTVVSVLEQEWPADRMVVVVSDDGHDPELARAVAHLPVLYHEPPPLWAPGRDGAPKSGNLNSAVQMLAIEHPEITYVETRDSDDELGSVCFLRHAVGQLEADARLAYVQTVKESQVSAGDPFNNRESMFYRGQMLARNAANAVFPCGSGLVWRRAALEDIGLFPTWNLVEDLQSGFEALRRGWRSCYLPIVGAVGQHSPEDLPNVYKQRGTWAIDTVRLLLWRDRGGLGLRQRMFFGELLLYYLQSFLVLVYVPSLILALVGLLPFRTTATGFLVHMLPLVLATEAWLLVVNRPYNDRRGRQRRPIRELWRVRILWSGLAPVFMKAALLAIVNGPNRKPVYRVTRKTDDPRWHWGHTLPQALVVMLFAATFISALRFGTLPRLSLLLPTVYWGALNIALLAGFIARGWHGVRWLGRGGAPAPVAARPEPEADPRLSAA